jgi:hypothetical protein
MQVITISFSVRAEHDRTVSGERIGESRSCLFFLQIDIQNAMSKCVFSIASTAFYDGVAWWRADLDLRLTDEAGLRSKKASACCCAHGPTFFPNA